MIGLTHTGHTQVIVEVKTPFTSLCGYLTDVNSGGVVRQPLYPSLYPQPFLGMLCTRPKPIPLLPQPSMYPHPLSPLSPPTLHLGTEDHCTMSI